MADRPEDNQHTLSRQVLELFVAGLFILLSLVVMSDNWRIGARWASDGPEAGYFPFYIGLIMLVASTITFLVNLRRTPALAETFVERAPLMQVLWVFIPTAVFVAAISVAGIYVASTLFIAFFMVVLGRYSIWKAIPIAVLVPVVLFMMFEVWFLVPLPKGPLEAALGY
ncbi:tripartite tricarboxylate transporter TctB family protein [Prosthecomicrobium hirschii]|uniref:tripartite tricarboxylate transporter TctB family protein n=1 Tax=Prosthecodimorpha hirschii TaxID=665126 RepID=UPI0022202BD1|nr:tripartite tricarboxylate transporter TctB family protein [Prosthecomicrobium hirschii]MCW1841959.1 tripartite tricarboxylate transporter TctB family protein [Prosthecomicrobium hirschii]